jgi:hypothetical protein
MWFSVHILKRPVLYIFRNLTVDQTQLINDINDFNIRFIKSIFDQYNTERQYSDKDWKEYKLPPLRPIGKDLDNLSNKDDINTEDMFCCLMNHTQLTKINNAFNEYIHCNEELVDITVITDESDLMGPTSSNDSSNKTDKTDTTASEILLAKIKKKVKYSLDVTGTAHSSFYNVSTTLTNSVNIQTKISKIHKMKRSDDYYGLFNYSI